MTYLLLLLYLLFWAAIVAILFMGVVTLIGGLVLFTRGIMRSARKTAWLGILAVGLGGVLTVPTAFLWFDRLQAGKVPPWLGAVAWWSTVAVTVIAFSAVVRCSWKERQWDIEERRK